MLVAAGYEPVVVVRVEANPEDRQITQVAECDGSVLLPVEDLDRKRPIHPDRDQLGAVLREAEVQDSAPMRSVQDLDGFLGLRVPDVDSWVNIDFAGGKESLEWMFADARNLHRVALVELLLLGCKQVRRGETYAA